VDLGENGVTAFSANLMGKWEHDLNL
jgi:hypothetical protein